MLTIEQMRETMEKAGMVIGDRDPRLNTDYPGRFMVAEPYTEDELPTKDGSNGPWCIVGDDLDALIRDSYDSALHDWWTP